MGNNKGDIARQMAAAPQPENTKPAEGTTEPADEIDTTESAAGRLNANPFGFGSVIFKAANPTAKVYDEGGRKTKKLASVLVELGNGRTYLKGSVKAVLLQGQAKPIAEFGWFGSMNAGSCIAGDDPAGIVAMAAVKADIVNRWRDWRKTQAQVAYVPAGAVVVDDVTL